MASDQSAREAAARAQAGTESPEATQQQVPRQAAPRQEPRYERREETRPSGAAGSLTLVAAILLMISGAWNILEGIAAIVHTGFVVVVRNYAYSLSATGWGVFHLILGAVVLAAGIALITDKLWARAVGVAIAAISMLVNFLYIPYSPVWSIALIAVDAVILWALLTPRRRYY